MTRFRVACALMALLACFVDVAAIENIISASNIIAAGFRSTCVLSSIGEVRCVGRATTSPGWKTQPPSLSSAKIARLLAASSNNDGNCGVDQTDSLHCWGVLLGPPFNNPTISDLLTSSGPLALAATSVRGETLCVVERRLNASVVCTDQLLRYTPRSGVSRITHLINNGHFICVAVVLDTSESAIFCDAKPQTTTAFALVASAPGVIVASASVVELCSGLNHVCYLLSNGGVKCFDGTPQPPTAPMTSFRSISCGSGFTCGVEAFTGAAYCWGATAPSAPSGSWVALSSGFAHVCGMMFALPSDPYPSPVCFGLDTAGETKPPNARLRAVIGNACSIDVHGSLMCVAPTMGLPDNYAIAAAGAPFAFAAMTLTCLFVVSETDRRFIEWGMRCNTTQWAYRQEVVGAFDEQYNQPVTHMCAGADYVCVLTAGGRVTCSGLPSLSWLDEMQNISASNLYCLERQSVCYANATDRTHIVCKGYVSGEWFLSNSPTVGTCGDTHCCFLVDGRMECVGVVNHPQSWSLWGMPTADTPSPVSYLSISALLNGMCGVTHDGDVLCYGPSATTAVPKQCSGQNVQNVSCGFGECCAWNALTSFCWGVTTNAKRGAPSFSVPALTPEPAPIGYYAPAWNQTIICPPGTVANQRGYSNSLCGGACSAGRYQNASGASSCGPLCPVGYFCPARALEPVACPLGRFGVIEGDGSSDCSGPCPIGYYCPTGTNSSTAFPCPAGRYGASQGLGDASCSGPCQAGFVCPEASTRPNRVSCSSSESYCPEGSASVVLVTTGFYRSNASSQEMCTPGTFCLNGIKSICGQGSYTSTGAASSCTDCPAGRFQTASINGSSACFECGLNSYTPIAGQSACIVCPDGPSVENRTSCLRLACPLGFRYSSVEGRCVECPSGTYGIGGGLDDTGRCVLCPSGTYTRLNASTECIPCASDGSMTCISGQVFVSKGFWVSMSDDGASLLLTTCPDRLCLGWSTDGGASCAANRISDASNLMCRDCAPGFAEWAGTCIPCGNETNGGFAFLWVFLSWIYVIVLHRLSQKTVGATGIYLFYIQMARTIISTVLSSAPIVRNSDGSLGTPNGDTASGLVTWLKFMEFDAQDINLDYCPMRTGATQKYLLSVGATALAFLQLFCTLAVHYCYVRFCTHPDRRCKSLLNAEDKYNNRQRVRDGKERLVKLKDSYFRSVMTLLMFTYSKQATACINYFICIDVEGESVLRSDPAVSCLSSDYSKGLVLVVSVFVIHVVIFPLTCAALLWYNRQTLRQEVPMNPYLTSLPTTTTFVSTHVARDWKLRLGALCEPYRGDSFWWQLTVMARRVCVSVIFSIVLDYSFALVLLGMMIVVATAAHVKQHPFLLERDNAFESSTLIATAIILLLALKSVDSNARFASAAAASSASSAASSSSAAAFTLVLLVALAVFTCVFTAVFLHMVLRKSATITRIFFCCFKQSASKPVITTTTVAPASPPPSPSVEMAYIQDRQTTTTSDPPHTPTTIVSNDAVAIAM